MYVLFITMGYPTEKYKGHGIFEFDQAKALNNLGCKVIYATIDVRSIRRWRKWGYERKRIDGIEIYGINIPLGRVPKKILTQVSIWGLKFLYKKILREEGKPNILHAHFTELGYIASTLKNQTNIPFVITEHSSLINKANIEKRLYKKASIAYKKADALIAVSPTLSQRIEDKFFIKPIYIPNIVDTQIFKYLPKVDNKKFNFVSIGNLIYSKRMDLTIEAFNKAFNNNNNATLTIFGEGSERVRLEEIISKYNLSKRVELKGMCSRSCIAKQLSKSDCFVLASQSETFGVAYIEALAMGIPVIATKCGGPEGFVNKDNGIMIDVNNENQLIEAIKYMYDNIGKYDRKSIAMETKERFSPKTVANKIIEVYKGALHDEANVK